MSIQHLPTTYADSETEQYEYQLTPFSDNEYLIEDVSEYTEEGSPFYSVDINNLSKTTNEVIALTEGSQNAIARIKSGTQSVGKSANTDTAQSSNNDFILCVNKPLVFENKVCTLSDERITSNSLADVIFTNETLDSAKKAIITANTSSGTLTLTAGRTPSNLVATIRIRRID